MRWIAFDEDGLHAEIFGELNVRERVADHQAARGSKGREALLRLKKQPGPGLAALAGVFVMRADEEAVDMRIGAGQLLLKFLVDGVQRAERVEPERNAALVRGDQYALLLLVELGNGLGHAGQHMEIGQRAHVFPFRHLAVQNAIAIKKDCFKILERETQPHILHIGMI